MTSQPRKTHRQRSRRKMAMNPGNPNRRISVGLYSQGDPETPISTFDAIRRAVSSIGGVELPSIARDLPPEPLKLES